jgi:hypothetical protein
MEEFTSFLRIKGEAYILDIHEQQRNFIPLSLNSNAWN